MATKKNRRKELNSDTETVLQKSRDVHKRNTIKQNVTRFQEFIESFNETQDIKQMQLRLSRFEKLIDEFDDIQCKIEYEDPQEAQESERAAFEAKYYEIIAKAERIIALRTPNHKMTAGLGDNDNKHDINICSPQIKLPVITLPTFSGDYDHWLLFADTFQSLVHSNLTLTPVQKFHYLRTSLKGDALQVIHSLEMSADNYEVAWTLITQRYQNLKLIVNNHVNALFEFPAIQKEGHAALRSLFDSYNKHVRALTSLKLPTQSWDTLLIRIITSKLDQASTREWEISQSKFPHDQLPTMQDLNEFLQQRCQFLEMVDGAKPSVTHKQHASPSNQSNKQQARSKNNNLSFAATTTNNCPACDGSHPIFTCNKFRQLPVDQRIKVVNISKLCYNCLKPGHTPSDCSLGHCRCCKKKHNTLLHVDEALHSNDNQSEAQPSVSTHAAATNVASSVLLSTALVKTYNKSGQELTMRVLLDSGSQSCFMTKEAKHQMGLKSRMINMPISGISGTITNASEQVETTIHSFYNAYKTTLKFVVISKITEALPIVAVDKCHIQIPQNIQLADPNFSSPAKIDMLLGAEVFYELLCVGQLKQSRNGPVFQKTNLGWIVSGSIHFPTQSANHHKLQNAFCTFTSNTLEKAVSRFWELEELPRKPFFTEDERLCEQHFTSHTTRDKEGRFVVALPIRPDSQPLGDSKQMAMNRFMSLERKLNKQPKLRMDYTKFMTDYEELGHMTRKQEEDSSEEVEYYLPHHAVVNESSTTTKLRVVFDGSAKTTTGYSLNQTLLVGPTIQDDLFDIVLRFRTHQYVFTADITKMYRQMNVRPEDRRLQQILWRNDPSHPISIYRLNTITYGTASAPFLAIRCLKQLAIEDGAAYPLAATVLQRDFYVDDVLTGSPTKEELLEVKSQLTKLLARGKLELQKWKSNNPVICTNTTTNMTNSLLASDKQETSKTLGLLWNSNNDQLEYSVCLKNPHNNITKRTILSMISQIFDPLGLIGPILTTAKIIMQRLWQLNVNWDESLPVDIYTTWVHYHSSIRNVNQVSIPRKVIPCNNTTRIELHGFCDASEAAYGACLYVRCTTPQGQNITQLLCSKSRVAPLKAKSIPRLELCGALLLAQLTTRVTGVITDPIDNIYFWTDSTIVLAWIATSPNKLKTFVANRISDIQELTDCRRWKHVQSHDNPADAISRGLTPDQLIDCAAWWTGPSWLAEDEEHWPQTAISKQQNEKEMELKTVLLLNTVPAFELFNKYSSMKKLTRIVAYCIRFKNNCFRRQKRSTDPISVEELHYASIVILRTVQQQSFEAELLSLRQKKNVHPASKLITLNPFLDETGLIRVGGRLKNAIISYNQKFPIVLPSKHVVTELIIREEHLKQCHAGPQSLLATIRLTYWPLLGRNAVRNVTRKCITCFRNNPKASSQFMGDLPTKRIQSTSRPFINCGIDYCGPIQIREGKRRGRIPISKAYVAVIVCFATKAVHLELVGDLTTESLMSALRRFMSRRGVCTNLYSDNATNFTGANKELQDLYGFLAQEKNHITTNLATQGISWHFIPARSPHFGGLWEAAVKSVKFHLRRTTGNAIFTYEEYYTFLVQIEAILNSRPLIPLSSDPNDFTALTPSHFLIGDSLLALPDYDYQDTKTTRLSRWQHIQKVKQHFWTRWSHEYLGHLQQRTKWKWPTGAIWEVGALVLLKDDNQPPCRWTLGRISAIHPGKDGEVRVVSVRTSNNVYKRAIARVCVLPIDI